MWSITVPPANHEGQIQFCESSDDMILQRKHRMPPENWSLLCHYALLGAGCTELAMMTFDAIHTLSTLENHALARSRKNLTKHISCERCQVLTIAAK